MSRYFAAHAVVDVGRIAGVKLLIAEPFGGGTISEHQSFRIEGPIITVADIQHTVLYAEPRYTIPLNTAGININTMANKISVSSVGKVIECAPRAGIDVEPGATLVTVSHRDWDPTVGDVQNECILPTHRILISYS